MNEVERQKQQKQFIDTHNLGLDRERMMAKPLGHGSNSWLS
tara:strand:+ start:1462 stop:1584 length:123 start_codon:yes stop_codon:yes gene_type:complete